MQQILSCFCLIPLLTAAESPGDPTHGLIWIRLDRFSKKLLCLWPATGVCFLHSCVVERSGAAQALVDSNGSKPVALFECSWVQQASTQIRLSQIAAIKLCTAEIGAPQRCPSHAAEAEICIAQVSPIQAGSAEVGSLQISRFEVCIAEIRMHQIRIGQPAVRARSCLQEHDQIVRSCGERGSEQHCQ